MKTKFFIIIPFFFLNILLVNELKAQTYPVDKGAVILPYKIHYASPWRNSYENRDMIFWQSEYAFEPELNAFPLPNVFLGGQLNFNKSVHQSNFSGSSFCVGPKMGIAAGHLFSDVFPYFSLATLLTGYKDNNASNEFPPFRGYKFIVKGGIFVSLHAHLGLDISLSYKILDEKTSLYDRLYYNNFVFEIGFLEFLFS